jgi:hypothetical protein
MYNLAAMHKNPAGHILPSEKKTYNERLFSGGIRKYFHEARFVWLRKALKKLDIRQASVLELGCYDGKLLNYLPFRPAAYVGYDANWENGLELASKHWAHFPAYQFEYCNDIKSFNPQLIKFDISVCMETLEHLPLHQLDDYISHLRKSTKDFLFVTVPNEKGPMVMLKYGIKKLFLKIDEPYTFRELANASVGNLSAVPRLEYGHKGFDYHQLINILTPHFKIISVQPIPFSFLPSWMNFSIGIIARPLTLPVD